MNIFRGSLNLCFGAVGLRGWTPLRSQLNGYRNFSATNSIRNKDNSRIYDPDMWSDCEEFEEKINNMKYMGSQLKTNSFDYETEDNADVDDDKVDNTLQRGRHDLNNVTHKSKFDSMKFTNEEKDYQPVISDKKACFFMLKKYCEEEFGNHIFISEESIMVDLVRRGLKPKHIFVNKSSLIDDIHPSLLDFPIHDAGQYMNSISFGKPLIGFFNYAELNKSAKNLEPKIPITIISDYNNYGRFIPKLFRFAAEIGCEKFIFNRVLPKFSHSKVLSEIDVSILKTEFVPNLEDIFETIDSDYKILSLTYGHPKNLNTNSDYLPSTDTFHALCDDDAWDKDKIALVITKNKGVESWVKNFSAARNNDYKCISSPYLSRLKINQKTLPVLFELTREYFLRNSSTKKKTKKIVRKKSK